MHKKSLAIAIAIVCVSEALLAAESETNPDLPNVLIIGDSISIGYMKPLQALLDGKAVVIHNAGNAAHSGNGVAKLDDWLSDTEWDVIHFNHGLHDLKYVDANGEAVTSKEKGQLQVPLDAYKKNLEAIAGRLEKTGAKLIFATTTPVPDNVDGPYRESGDSAKYNSAALEIMQNHGVAIDDLYTFALPRLGDIQRPRNVHFTAEGYEALAKEVARHISRSLGLPEDGPSGDHAAQNYEIKLDTIHSGFDKSTCWVHPRAGTIPGETPIVVLTMQKLLLSGSDIFYALNEMRTDDLGAAWSGPVEHESLGRVPADNGGATVVCDFTPKWHAKTGKLLGTGHTATYGPENTLIDERPRSTAYSVYDPGSRDWSTWRAMDMPQEPIFYNSGAGCSQRVDLPNGDILLPFYCRPSGTKKFSAGVLRCRFDGETLAYVEHGDLHTVAIDRGMVEPSLAECGGRYFLTIRNDQSGYVTVGDDGLHFPEPKKWEFDDGQELGSYNTQQHWVTHGGVLYLVYTRRGANNDHVFRHRAPLFIAEVDQKKLCVIRNTERVLVPERGARLGNFAVTDVNENETWVTVAEWMQPVGIEKYGSDNTVYAARIMWK